MIPAASRRFDLRDLAAIVMMSALFALSAGRELRLPGLWYDEAGDAIYGMQIVQGAPLEYTDWKLSLGKRVWPLRVFHPYDFSIANVYLSALAFRIGGVSVESLRVCGLLVAMLLLILTYVFARMWFERTVALAAGLLLAFSPVFQFMARLTFFAAEIFIGAVCMAALCLLTIWQRRRAPAALYWGCFLWGFSANISTKAAAFLLAFPVLYALFVPRRTWPSRRQAVCAGLCALLGAANPIVYSFASGFPIFKRLLIALLEPTDAGVRNLELAANGAVRLRQLTSLCSGEYAASIAGATLTAERLFEPLLIFSGAGLAIRAALGRERRVVGFILALAAMLFIETCLTPSSLDAQHLMVVWPFAALIAALGLSRVAEFLSPHLALVVLCAVLASQARTSRACFSGLKTVGGAGLWSDSIYDVAAYLEKNDIRRPLCLTWGMRLNLAVITGGRIEPVDAHNAEREPDELAVYMYRRALRDAANRYLAPSDAELQGVVGREYARLFFKVVARSGHKLVLEREFYDRRGQGTYRLYRVEPART